MQTVVIREHGGPETLTPATVPRPEPGPGEARIKVGAAGVNFIDVYFRTGLYPADLPMVPGVEVAGVIDAVGAGVSEFTPGDRVAAAWQWGGGGYSEWVVRPVAELVPVPDGVDDRLAAAALLQGMTAHYLVRSIYTPSPGETAVVHAAGGGTGALVTQMAHRAGARVIATTSSEAKAAGARASGAEEVIDYTRDDFAAEVLRLTGGAGAAVVYDGVGRTTFDGSLACLRSRGYLVLFGQSSGKVPPFDPSRLATRALFLTRPVLHAYIANRDELLVRARDVFAGLADRSLRVSIWKTYPLADAAVAHRDLESRRTTGKLLLIP